MEEENKKKEFSFSNLFDFTSEEEKYLEKQSQIIKNQNNDISKIELFGKLLKLTTGFYAIDKL